ncbi:DUF1205 domain-containing protein [Conyzicola nivalis]|uniref:Glycosyl transferase n=1 Tax=Conyzicola nivalis TaxID=1477021 RepID=A0A916SNE6_9MICO|nr:nucleotide disphospho-sugar-binding domain-containing protein [Conyzicola nivalis]GGB06033.1 glycosyl transferase [Conyzicola nivalis]
MRIAFSANPMPGHIVPMIPLMRAAVGAGHAVALITGADAAPFVRAEVGLGVDVLEAGPATREAMSHMARVTGSSPLSDPRPAVIADYFAARRLDASIGDAVRTARDWEPDVVVSESLDFVGPAVAAVLGVPFVRHTLGPERPALVRAALSEAATRAAAAHGITLPPVSAWIDGYPAFLEDPSVVRSGRRIPIRPEPHSAAADRPSQDAPVHDPSSPTVLVTMGTVFTGQELLDEMVASIEAVGVPLTLLITSVNGISARGTADDSPVRIVDVPFRPLAELLEGVDAVVTVGGAGTVLGALTSGVPLVVMPLGADHEINAARAVATGAAVRVSTPGEVGPALLRDLLADGALLRAARSTADRIRVLPAASTALDALADVIAPFAATPAAAIRLETQQ